ncbi:replication restart DNA helicase PriA [Ruminococcaceae bacterium KH2T8]|nr:replication restart DNA helicase PriA [Ruminococcaceae bacterium KH2T8]
MLTAQVILRDSVRATDKLFTYKVPDSLREKVIEGLYVLVPFGFGNRMKTAVVYSVQDQDPGKMKLKAIFDVMDDIPVMTKEQLQLIKPLASRLLCTMGDVVSLMVPSVAGKSSLPQLTYISLMSDDDAKEAIESGKLRSITHIHILEYLLEKGETEKKELLAACKATEAQLKAVRDKGFLYIEKREDDEAPIKSAIPEGEISEEFSVIHTLNDEQSAAVEAITASDKAEVFLLHGITGSGKTEVYLKCAGDAMQKGGSVIYLVPEISLTPQTVNWIRARFGDTAAVMHSRLTDKQRFLEWEKIRRGQAQIVVGPRSCIFAPLTNLKLIIIDEEHDSSYKSESFPKYNARDIALMRAKLNSCAVVLGSATPAVSSYYAAQKGVYRLLTLKKRGNPDAVLPKVHIVDMKEQIKAGAGDLISIPLRHAMARAIADNKQILLFLNRRGYSRTLICEECGEPCSCPNCSVGMTLHNGRTFGGRQLTGRMLICHYCGYTVPAHEALCRSCGGGNFTRAGIGTQQLEEMLGKTFAGTKVLRMDQDTTMRPGDHEKILAAFRDHEAQILIGTQMIAKGHDFPDVTVVGIIGADLIASSSDYRSSERAFQLITQAAGRAGRKGSEGTVYLQSLHTDNPLLHYAARQDYEAFYEEEIKYREAMALPPFKASGEIVLSLPNEDDLLERTDILAKYLKDFLSVQPEKYAFELYGPVPSPIYELRGRYRMSFMIKAVNKSSLNAVFAQIMKDFDPEIYPISFDNDCGG